MPNAWNPRDQHISGFCGTPNSSKDPKDREANLVRQVKWVTADNNACPICLGNKVGGGIYTQQTLPKWPAHPNCRCELHLVLNDSRFIDGEIEVGSQRDLYNRVLARLEGYNMTHNEEDTNFFTGFSGTETTVVRDTGRKGNKKSNIVRTGSMSSVMRAFSKAKDSAIRMMGLSNETQSMQGMRFGSNGRRFVSNKSVLNTRGRTLKRMKEDDESEMSPKEEERRNFVRAGIVVELVKLVESIFDLF